MKQGNRICTIVLLEESSPVRSGIFLYRTLARLAITCAVHSVRHIMHDICCVPLVDIRHLFARKLQSSYLKYHLIMGTMIAAWRIPAAGIDLHSIHYVSRLLHLNL